MTTLRTHLLVALTVLAPAGPARGDVAPPADYVDPCKSIVLDASCQRCTSPEFKARACHQDARTAGLVERCSGWGYTMYCSGTPTPTPAAEPAPTPTPAPAAAPQAPPTPAPAAEAPKPPASGGCTIASAGDVWAFAALALFFGFSRRRRGRRHDR